MLEQLFSITQGYGVVALNPVIVIFNLLLAFGMATGPNNYLIAVATTAIVLLVLFALHKLNFGSIRKFDYLLNFSLDTSRQAENIYKPVFDKYLKSSSLLNIKAIESGQILQLSFSIKFITESDAQTFTTELERLNGIANVNLITAKNDVEY